MRRDRWHGEEIRRKRKSKGRRKEERRGNRHERRNGGVAREEQRRGRSGHEGDAATERMRERERAGRRGRYNPSWKFRRTGQRARERGESGEDRRKFLPSSLPYVRTPARKRTKETWSREREISVEKKL